MFEKGNFFVSRAIPKNTKTTKRVAWKLSTWSQLRGTG